MERIQKLIDVERQRVALAASLELDALDGITNQEIDRVKRLLWGDLPNEFFLDLNPPATIDARGTVWFTFTLPLSDGSERTWEMTPALFRLPEGRRWTVRTPYGSEEAVGCTALRTFLLQAFADAQDAVPAPAAPTEEVADVQA